MQNPIKIIKLSYFKRRFFNRVQSNFSIAYKPLAKWLWGRYWVSEASQLNRWFIIWGHQIGHPWPGLPLRGHPWPVHPWPDHPSRTFKGVPGNFGQNMPSFSDIYLKNGWWWIHSLSTIVFTGPRRPRIIGWQLTQVHLRRGISWSKWIRKTYVSQVHQVQSVWFFHNST